MRIQPVNNYYVTNLNSSSKNSKNTVRNNVIAFGAINWNKAKLDILNKNPYELREIAEYFHKSSESELREITGLYNLRKKREKAYNMLINAIQLVKLQKDNWLLHLSLLSKPNLTEAEQAAKLDYENKINDLNIKFESRVKKFENEIIMPDPDELRQVLIGRELGEWP